MSQNKSEERTNLGSLDLRDALQEMSKFPLDFAGVVDGL
jgi:hypothetical protein